MIEIKSKEEIELIREASQTLSKVILVLKGFVRGGVTTADLDQKAKELIINFGGIPAFKGYRGFPGNICTSVNEVVVHGIPGKRKLKEGDVLSLDIGVKLNGYFSDMAVTLAVGEISEDAKRLLKVTEEALYIGIRQAIAGNRLSNLSHAIQSFVEANGFSVVRKFVGHGIGTRMHEEPEIPNFGKPDQGIRLKPGMVFAIEPMVNMGSYEVKILDDGWTAVTKDKKLSAHFEHTICITDNSPEILTKY